MCRPFALGLLLLLLFSAELGAQQLPQNLQPIHQSLLALQLKGLKEELRKTAKKGQEAQVAYLANTYDFIYIALTEDPKAYRQAEELKDKREKAIEQYQPAAARNYLLAELKLQWAFMHYRFQDQLQAVWHIRQAHQLLKRALRKDKDYLPAKKSMGLLLTTFGTMPRKYQWISKTLGFEANTQAGLDYLADAAQGESFAQLESQVWQALTKYFLLKQESNALLELEKMAEVYPKNYLVAFIRMALMMKMGRSAAAIELMDRFDRPEYLHPAYEDYFRALQKMYEGRYKQALPLYLRFIEQHKGRSYIKDAYLRMAACYAFLEDQKAVDYYLKKVLRNGMAQNSADAYAQELALGGELPYLPLLEVRYATDGGYYDRALGLLKELDTTTMSQPLRIEYHYRKARVIEARFGMPEALTHYLKVLEAQGFAGNYYQPNTALLLGDHFFDEGQFTKARQYLNRCMEYEDHPYESDMEAEAKALLQQIP